MKESSSKLIRIIYFSPDKQRILKKVWRKITSENVKEADLSFFLLANMMAETASLELVANGRAMNDMKKVGIFVAVEKFWTESTRGSANAAAMRVPRSNRSAAFTVVHFELSTPSSLSSFWTPKRKCCLFVSWKKWKTNKIIRRFRFSCMALYKSLSKATDRVKSIDVLHWISSMIRFIGFLGLFKPFPDSNNELF